MERTGESAAISEQVRTPPTKVTYAFEEFASLYRDDLEPSEQLKEAAQLLNLYKPHPVSIEPKRDDEPKKVVRNDKKHAQVRGPPTLRKANSLLAAQRTSAPISAPRLNLLIPGPIRREAPARTGTSEAPSLQTLKKSPEGSIRREAPARTGTSEALSLQTLKKSPEDPVRRKAPAKTATPEPLALQALKKSLEDLRISASQPAPFLSIPTTIDTSFPKKKFLAEVTVVCSPSYFYVVPLAERQLYQTTMEDTFNRILNGSAFIDPYDPLMHGDFCCVRTAQLEFSRGYCYEFDARLKTAKVYFIDSGMRRSVRKECLLPMPRELDAIPPLAAHCSLLGTPRSGDGKDERAELSFMKQVSKKRFVVVVHWRSNTCIVPGLWVPSLCVELIEEEQEKRVYNGSIMAAGKYVK